MVRPQVMIAAHKISEAQPATRASMGGTSALSHLDHVAINAALKRDRVDRRDSISRTTLVLKKMLL